MTTWWKTGSYRQTIEPVEVIRETAQMVVLSTTDYRGRAIERKQAKDGSYENFFATWEAAQAHLLKKAEGAVANARRALEIANSTLGNVKGLKKPEAT